MSVTAASRTEGSYARVGCAEHSLRSICTCVCAHTAHSEGNKVPGVAVHIIQKATDSEMHASNQLQTHKTQESQKLQTHKTEPRPLTAQERQKPETKTLLVTQHRLTTPLHMSC